MPRKILNLISGNSPSQGIAHEAEELDRLVELAGKPTLDDFKEYCTFCLGTKENKGVYEPNPQLQEQFYNQCINRDAQANLDDKEMEEISVGVKGEVISYKGYKRETIKKDMYGAINIMAPKDLLSKDQVLEINISSELIAKVTDSITYAPSNDPLKRARNLVMDYLPLAIMEGYRCTDNVLQEFGSFLKAVVTGTFENKDTNGTQIGMRDKATYGEFYSSKCAPGLIDNSSSQSSVIDNSFFKSEEIKNKLQEFKSTSETEPLLQKNNNEEKDNPPESDDNGCCRIM